MLPSRTDHALTIIGILLIVASYFLPGLGEDPVPLAALLLTISKYSVGIVHAIAVATLTLAVFFRFKRGTYWIALAATLTSFYAQLIYSVECGLFLQIASGRAYDVLVLSLGQVLALTGLVIHRLRAVEGRLEFAPPWKCIVLWGVSVLILVAGSLLVALVLLLVGLLK